MLAQEKLKQQLQNLIKQIRLKDEVKKHLRVKLAERLQKSQQLPQFQITSDTLRHRIISSIIKQHLDKIGCSYSSSVFAAESLCDEKMLQRVELIELLNLQTTYEGLSLMECIIEKAPGRGTFMRTNETQTDQEEGRYTLEQKFTMMDLQYRRALEQKNTNPIIGKSHNCEEQRKWYEKELLRFRQFQAHKIKIKAGEEWRIKFQNYAADIQNDYKRKLERMRNKEKTLTDELATKQKDFAEKVKNFEANAKSRLELIQMKEGSVARQKMNLELQRKRALDDAKKVHDEAKQKGREYESLLLNVQKRIDYEVGIVKLSLQQAQNQKQQEFANRRKFVDQEYGKLMGIKDTMDLLKVQNERLGKQNTVLREQCKKLREELRTAYNQTNKKGDRIDNLREELTDAKNDLKDLEIKIEEERKLRSKRQAEVLEARRQLQGLRKKIEFDNSESSIDLGQRKGMNDLDIKMLELREQRKKQIERFKLQI